MSLEDSLYYRVSTLAGQMEKEIRESDDIESPLTDILASFLELLQEKTGITDDQIRECIRDYIHAQRVSNPAFQLAWAGYTYKNNWGGES